MRNKALKITGILMLLMIALSIAVYTFVRFNKKSNNLGQITEKQQPKVNIVDTASKSEEVILPSAKIIMKQHYKKCGHTTINEFSVPEDIVNMTKEQVERYYFGWNVVKFSEKELIIEKENPGLCDEHYIVKDKDGSVNVYSKNEKGEEELVYATEVNTKYLPKEDCEKLKKGIEIIGKENLYTLLEDYE